MCFSSVRPSVQTSVCISHNIVLDLCYINVCLKYVLSSLLNYFKIASFDFSYLEVLFFQNFAMDLCYIVS